MRVVKPDNIVRIHSSNDSRVFAVIKNSCERPVREYEPGVRRNWTGLYDKLDPNLGYSLYLLDEFVSPRLKGYKCLKKEI